MEGPRILHCLCDNPSCQLCPLIQHPCLAAVLEKPGGPVLVTALREKVIGKLVEYCTTNFPFLHNNKYIATIDHFKDIKPYDFEFLLYKATHFFREKES